MKPLDSAKQTPPEKRRVFLWNPENAAVLDGAIYRYKPRSQRPYIWILLFLALVVSAAVLEWTDLYLREAGERATATVVSHRTTTYNDKHGQHTSYLVTYRFVLADHSYTNETYIAEDLYNRTAIDLSIDVVYDPKSPDVSDPLDNVMRFPLLTLGSLVAGIIGGVIYWRKWHYIARLRSEGTVIRTSLGYFTAKGRGKRKNEFDVVFQFQFNAPDGHPIDALVKHTLSKQAFESIRSPEPGEPIAVLYIHDKYFALL